MNIDCPHARRFSAARRWRCVRPLSGLHRPWGWLAAGVRPRVPRGWGRAEHRGCAKSSTGVCGQAIGPGSATCGRDGLRANPTPLPRSTGPRVGSPLAIADAANRSRATDRAADVSAGGPFPIREESRPLAFERVLRAPTNGIAFSPCRERAESTFQAHRRNTVTTAITDR